MSDRMPFYRLDAAVFSLKFDNVFPMTTPCFSILSTLIVSGFRYYHHLLATYQTAVGESVPATTTPDVP
jgi:hypothetical protein